MRPFNHCRASRRPATRTALAFLSIAKAAAAQSATCPPPSATTCQDATFIGSCPAAKDPVTGCGPILARVYHAQYNAKKASSASRAVILPTDMIRETAPAAYPGTVFDDGLGMAANRVQITNAGTGGGTAADVLGTLAFYGSHPFTVPRYTAGDQTMSSCAEYAWKKWGTYSWWNDVALASGTDYASPVLAASNSSLPYAFLLNPSRWDGQPVGVNTETRRKILFVTNPFFGFDPGDSTDPTLQAIRQAILAADPNADIGDAPPSHSGVQVLAFDDYTFSPRVYAAHLTAGVTDAHYVTGSVRAERYGTLIAHLKDVTANLGVDRETLHSLLLGGPVGETAGGRPLPSNSLGSAVVKAVREDIAALEAERSATLADVQAMLIAEWNFDPDHGCLGRTFHGHAVEANYCDWSPQLAMREYMRATDYRWQAYSRCIQDTGDDFTLMTSPAAQARIWTDPHFYRTYNDKLTDVEDLDGTDALGTPIKVDFLDAYEHRAEINDAEHTYQLQEIAKYEKMTEDLPLEGPSGRPSAIGRSAQDGNETGGDWFGAGYSYSAGWSLTPHNQLEFGQVPPPGGVPQICRIDAEIHGSLEAHAQLLQQKIQLVDATLRAHTGPGHVTLDDAHISMLGNDVMPAQTGDWTGRQFDVPVDSTPAEPSFGTIIPLLGIPISVGAGASLHLGAEAVLNAAPPPTCDVNNVSLSLSGSLVPHLTVDGKAWAAVDLAVVSAGVEGTLNIVTVQLPITTNVGLASDPTNGLGVAIDSEADLDMSELSGHVDLYAEVNVGFWSDRTQQTLFSWDGLHQSIKLYGQHKAYPLKALNYVFFQQVEP